MPRRFDDVPEDFSLPLPHVRDTGESLPISEINFFTDRTVYNAIEGGTPEIKAVCDCAPFSAFLTSDTRSSFVMWTKFPCTALRIATWEHFSTREAGTSSSKSVVSSMLFNAEELELVCGDDQGCVIVYDVFQLFEDTKLIDEYSATCTAKSALSAQQAHPGKKLSDVQIVPFPASDMPVLNCFLVKRGVPISGLRYITDRQCFIVGLATGLVTILGRDGTIFATLIPSLKYIAQVLPRFFYNQPNIVKESEERVRGVLANKPLMKWRLLRRKILGPAAVLRETVREKVLHARKLRDGVIPENASLHLDETSAGSDKAARRFFFSPAPTPPNSPTNVRDAEADWKILVRADHSEVIFDPVHSPKNLRRHVVNLRNKSEVDQSAIENAKTELVVRSVIERIAESLAGSDMETLEPSYATPALFEPSFFNAFVKPMQHSEHFTPNPGDFSAPPEWETSKDFPLTFVASTGVQQVLPVQTLGTTDITDPAKSAEISTIHETESEAAVKEKPRPDSRLQVTRGVLRKPTVLVADILPSQDTSVLKRRATTPTQLPQRLSESPNLAALLHASAPLYPLQPSPFFQPGRVPPALTPFLFPPGESTEIPDVEERTTLSSARSHSDGSLRRLMAINASRTSLLNANILQRACENEIMDNPRTWEAQNSRLQSKPSFTVGSIRRSMPSAGKIRKGVCGLVGGPQYSSKAGDRPATASKVILFPNEKKPARSTSACTMLSRGSKPTPQAEASEPFTELVDAVSIATSHSTPHHGKTDPSLMALQLAKARARVSRSPSVIS